MLKNIWKKKQNQTLSIVYTIHTSQTIIRFVCITQRYFIIDQKKKIVG